MISKLCKLGESMDWSLDGKIYKSTDCAPIGCNECADCSSCCHLMGDTIVQDPYDLWLFSSNMRLAGGAPVSFEILISEDGPWELSMQDGLILPNIKMVEDGRCPFLDEKGRCSIHKIRSGLCRLFPLGRGFEEDGTVSYYVLNKELGCEKLKGPGEEAGIKEWLGYDHVDEYEKFVYTWHELKEQLKVKTIDLKPEEAAAIQAKLLDYFYVKPYAAKTDLEFFGEFKKRLEGCSIVGR